MTLTSFIDSCWYVDVFEAQAIANVYLSRTQNAGSESTNYFEARTSRPTHIDPSRVYGDPSTDPALINIHYPPSRDQPSRYWQHRWFVQDSKDHKEDKWELISTMTPAFISILISLYITRFHHYMWIQNNYMICNDTWKTIVK